MYKKSLATMVALTALTVSAPAAMATTVPGLKASADVKAFAIMVQPIAITTTANLRYGAWIFTPGTEGSIWLKPDGSTVVNNATFAGVSFSDMHPAAFKVEGNPGAKYNVSIDPSGLSLSNGTGGIVKLNLFQNNSDKQINSNGTDNFNVGAKLNFDALTQPGNYEGDFKVTVEYTDFNSI